MIDLRLGDCLEVLQSMEDNSVDSIVTDPPYGLSFMGRKWDYDVPSKEIWEQCLRVLKPGGHLLAFAGTRTQHRMAVRIEDAGFEIREMLAWVYGQGFPKSLNVSVAIDKAAGAEREVLRERKKLQSYGNGVNEVYGDGPDKGGVQLITTPATPEAQQWDGWGTALKPALEPITMARKPFKGNVAANVLEHGTGAINVDGCRVGDSNGRWPANLIHDGSDEVTELFPQAQGMKKKILRRGATTGLAMGANGIYGEMAPMDAEAGYGDTGSAARFFYSAKANKKDREDGNSHPTVKPTDLMAYLCRLVTPPGGIVLDPFMGSGSTGKAAVQEGFNFIGIEREDEYHAIALERIMKEEMRDKQLSLFA